MLLRSPQRWLGLGLCLLATAAFGQRTAPIPLEQIKKKLQPHLNKSCPWSQKIQGQTVPRPGQCGVYGNLGYGCVEQVCKPCRTRLHCGGKRCYTTGPKKGFCSTASVRPIQHKGPIYPTRFLLTGSGWLLFPSDKPWGYHIAAGFSLQIALYRLNARPIGGDPTNGFNYAPEGLNNFSLQLSGALSVAEPLRFHHSLGLGWRTGSGLFTRLGLSAYGLLFRDGLSATELSYRLGAGLHVEIYHNLRVHVGYMFSVPSPLPGLFFLSLAWETDVGETLFRSRKNDQKNHPK